MPNRHEKFPMFEAMIHLLWRSFFDDQISVSLICHLHSLQGDGIDTHQVWM